MDNTIITGNKLIAEFMGIKVSDFQWRELHTLAICDNNGEVSLKDCEFYTPHDNWNQLMPVVDKIEDLNFSVNMEKHQCTIWDKSKQGILGLLIDADFQEGRINNCYDAVVSFTQWYNTSLTNK